MKVAPIFFGLMAIAQARIVPSNYFGRVINGKDVEPGEIPYQVSIQMTNSHIHFCGGSILNENYVITAAHCIMNHNPYYLEVIAGTTDLNSPQSTHFVDKLIIHEDYNQHDTWRNDIGLIKVIEPFVVNFFLNFVSLPSINQTITSDSVAVVSGWGRRKSGELSDVLQKTTTRIASQNYCTLVYLSFGFTIRNTHICSYDPHSETGACFGDSGGPLTVNGEIVGIVSWGKECASRYYPIVYTRVSEYIDWIKDNAI